MDIGATIDLATQPLIEQIEAQQKEIEQLKVHLKDESENLRIYAEENTKLKQDIEQLKEEYNNDMSRLLKKRQKTIKMNLDLASENTKLKQEIEQMKDKLRRVLDTAKLNIEDWNKCEDESTKLKQQLDLHKGISDGKSKVIEQLEQNLIKTCWGY
jgi:DNA repair exonuclease SbcCD ATPase subunit